eukprot:5243292-Prymnesium_polylepis.1
MRSHSATDSREARGFCVPRAAAHLTDDTRRSCAADGAGGARAPQQRVALEPRRGPALEVAVGEVGEGEGADDADEGVERALDRVHHRHQQ